MMSIGARVRSQLCAKMDVCRPPSPCYGGVVGDLASMVELPWGSGAMLTHATAEARQMGRFVTQGPAGDARGSQGRNRLRSRSRSRGKGSSEHQAALSGFQGVSEIKSDLSSDTFRLVYVADLPDAIYVLHAFKKKSKKGISIPKHEIDVIRARVMRAQEASDEEGKQR